MKRNHWVSLGGVILVFSGCVAFLLGGILRTPIAGGATTIDVAMPRTGGLFKGSGVTYQGIVVGKVVDIELAEDGVVATVRLNAGAEVPKASAVRVRSLTPIGEQYLDFRPQSPEGPFLTTGDHMTATAKDLPQSVGDLAISMNELMTQVDPTQVRAVLTELSTGLSGAEDDLQRLTHDSLTLVDTFDHKAALFSEFLRQGRTTLTIGAEQQDDIISATRDYATFVSWLKRFQPELYSMLDRAPAQLEEMRLLIGELTDVLPGFLDAQGDVSEILEARDPHLRAFLQEFPAALNAVADVIRDGRIQLDLLLRRGPLCDYATEERGARDTQSRPLQEDGFCSDSLTDYSQRGAQFAPRGVM